MTEKHAEPIKAYQLKNGLTYYIIRETRQRNSSMVCLSIKAGAALEKSGEKGWFHLLEHLSIQKNPYVSSSNIGTTEYFKTFNYAFTSFYETAYFFKTADTTRDLLKDSLMTAKGILDGAFLREAAFAQTKKDVLREYHAFTQKAWYSLCVKKLDSLSMTMPIGIEEDIQGADYVKLLQLRREYYRTKNAAVIITSPYDNLAVYDMLNRIFCKEVNDNNQENRIAGSCTAKNHNRKAELNSEIQPYVLLAWYPRKLLPVIETLEMYMLLTVIARSVEIALVRKEEISIAVCDVDIFSHSRYMFKLSLLNRDKMFSEDIVIRVLQDIPYTSELFETVKGCVLTRIMKQHGSGRTGGQAGESMNDCRKHFIFEEPVIPIGNECDIHFKSLHHLKYKAVKDGFEMILKQFAAVH